MITGPLIVTWVAGGVIGTLAGILTRKVWKKATKTEAQVDVLHQRLNSLEDGG